MKRYCRGLKRFFRNFHKEYLLISFITVASLLLIGCAATRSAAPSADLAHESWMGLVDKTPKNWLRGSDRWFLTGSPNGTELMNRHAPYDAAISTMMVKVPDFTHIQSNGDFQVQIFGTYGPNSVYVYGPNDGVRQITVEVRNGVLCINQTKNASYNVRRVIIRIGINNFRGLIQLGRGCIEGIQLHSRALTVTSAGSGNIYLAGNMNLHRVMSNSSGSVTVLGANTRALDITTRGVGNVNIMGQVGVRQISHFGNNNINIIGANSHVLNVYAEGKGKIGIAGSVNLCKVVAKQNTCVYVMDARSGSLYAYAYDRARIGVSGSADHLYVDTYQAARFEGRYLCAMSAFVRAHQSSHINVTAAQKIFAAATQDASVYFFGTPNVLSQFVSGNGVVMPIWYENMRACPVVNLPVRDYKSYKGEGNRYYSPREHWKNKAGEG